MKTIPIGVPDSIYETLRTLAAQRGVRMQDIFVEAVALTNPINVTVQERALLMSASRMPDAVVGHVLDLPVLTVKNWRAKAGIPATRLDRDLWAHVLEPKDTAA